MNRFYELLREEYEKILCVGGTYANKERVMQAFDKAFTMAIIRYSKELGVNLI